MKIWIRRSAWIAVALVAYAVGASTNASFADTNLTPGSASDPLVTKGYVDETVARLVQEELAKLPANNANKLEVVTVPAGQKLIVADGGEIVIRSGKAIAYSTDANGLSDMTDGVDIAPGKAVANNHLILFPRGGRGVETAPNQTNGLIVLVRGTYQLQ